METIEQIKRDSKLAIRGEKIYIALDEKIPNEAKPWASELVAEKSASGYKPNWVSGITSGDTKAGTSYISFNVPVLNNGETKIFRVGYKGGKNNVAFSLSSNGKLTSLTKEQVSKAFWKTKLKPVTVTFTVSISGDDEELLQKVTEKVKQIQEIAK